MGNTPIEKEKTDLEASFQEQWLLAAEASAQN